MNLPILEPWWNLRQALIWVATRDLGWVAAAKSTYGFGGRESRGDSFDELWALALMENDVLSAYATPGIAKSELVAKIADGSLQAAEKGTALPASEFMSAVCSDQDDLGTHIRRIDQVQVGRQYGRGDAAIYRPRFIGDQIRRLFPAVGSRSLPVSEIEKTLVGALEIEATANRRLADEYDAAQDRGEVQKHGKVEVPDGNLKAATLDSTLVRIKRGAPSMARLDAPFVELMRPLVEVDLHSPTAAAEIVRKQNSTAIAGGGTDASKERRLRDRYTLDRKARGLGSLGD